MPSTNLIVYSIYRDAFFDYRFGTAAAESVVLFLIILVLTLVMFKIEKKVQLRNVNRLDEKC